MLDCLLDGLIDTLKLLPYLFITFLLLEYLEHKLSKKNEKILKKNKKYGPLIAVFLATSDEMLPIMISEKIAIIEIIKIISIKVAIGLIAGLLIDMVIKHKEKSNDIHHLCEKEHCDCDEDGLIKSSIKHTIKIALFILIANLGINLIIYWIGEKSLQNLLLNNNIITYFIASLIGLIPNCASSVIMTELYVSNFISLGTLLSGLLTGSGLGILILFRTNDNIKENIRVLTIIYTIGVLVGLLIDIII